SGTVITADTMTRSMRLIDRIKHDLAVMLQQDLAFDDDSKMRQAVVRVLRNKGRCVRHLLLKLTNLDKKKFDAVMATLVESGQVVEERSVARNGKEAVYYTWTG